MTYASGFEDYEDEPREGEAYEDEHLRAALTEAAPEFPVTSALGDRALAGATRHRTRVRTFGGAGALATLAVAALAVAPLAGWGGHGSGAADAGIAPGALAASPSATAPPPPPSASLSLPAPPPITVTVSPPSYTPDVNSPKWKALDRVQNALQSGHDYSFMGVGMSGQDYTGGSLKAGSDTDWSPIVVYRKPVADPTLEQDAIRAAAPYTVVFRDTVLDASEQWFLGHRIGQDRDYWQGRGVVFGTSLQQNGTITIFASDPGAVVPLLEQHYGYDGRVFVGKVMPESWGSVLPPSAPSSTGG